MEKKLLTVAEASFVTGCSRSLLYLKLMSGEISSIKIGRARRIPVAALDEWIRHQREEAEADQNRQQLTPANQRLSSRRPSDA